MCVLKVVNGNKARLHCSVRNLPRYVWLMSIREDSKPELVLKDKGRLMKTRDGQLMLQGDENY